ncbi:hypothetical protein HALLA_08015 [Halostagnicola larsenii XH-48]|uniref:DUF8054 domain-containing protein n=1 Tax=Halostagnicola larsenii XH-48 TaxID=797299 RepID=W0JJB9_9EURY|nr:hypothetical protein [Halostagnicola larsenii]AHF98815.1 hypothetical protein HALLA_08015 [Halostagnicola larsenii XH-48]
MTFRDQIDRLRQPAYTGENRCTPCTILNVVIAAVLVAVAVGVTVSNTGLAAATVVGTVLAAVSGATIYLRGYLVPGTPRLTEAMLPARVRQWFEKRPSGVDDDAPVDLALKGVGATSNTDARRRSDERSRTGATTEDAPDSIEDDPDGTVTDE